MAGVVGGVPCLGVLKAFFAGVDGWRRGGCWKHGYGAAQELDLLIAQHLATSTPCQRVLLLFVCQFLSLVGKIDLVLHDNRALGVSVVSKPITFTLPLLVVFL